VDVAAVLPVVFPVLSRMNWHWTSVYLPMHASLVTASGRPTTYSSEPIYWPPPVV
jgi:hypothetical protein